MAAAFYLFFGGGFGRSNTPRDTYSATPPPTAPSAENSLSHPPAFIENAIRVFTSKDTATNSCLIQMYVVNPFEVSLTAIVTLQVPTGVKVLGSNGILGTSSITWTNNLPQGGPNARDTVNFTLSPTALGLTEFPAPTLMYTDSQGHNGTGFYGIVPPIQQSSCATR